MYLVFHVIYIMSNAGKTSRHFLQENCLKKTFLRKIPARKVSGSSINHTYTNRNDRNSEKKMFLKNKNKILFLRQTNKKENTSALHYNGPTFSPPANRKADFLSGIFEETGKSLDFLNLRNLCFLFLNRGRTAIAPVTECIALGRTCLAFWQVFFCAREQKREEIAKKALRFG